MEESIMKGLTGNLDDSLESELELIFNQRESRGAIGDQERGLNMHRSGSAPPIVEGSLSDVGNLYRNNGEVHIDDRNNNGLSTNDQVLSEEELIRSHPMYLSYYYAHGNFNPRFPPPLLSKEDWRVAQRFQVGGWSSSDGTKGGRRMLVVIIVVMRKAQKNTGESIIRNDGLIGLPTPTMGGRNKSFADILQEGLDQPESSSNQISRPASQNAVISNSYSSVLCNGKQTSSVPHSFTPVVGPSSKIQIVTMSLQKFASNVVETCLTYGIPEEHQLLVKEMLGSTDENEPLQAMMKDPFGNYVVQKVLETCDDQIRELILSRI